MTQTSEWTLEAVGIHKRFGPTVVLDDLEVKLERGEFATFLGPSGCGKTTLLRIAAGLDLPDAGALRICGQSMDGVPARQRPVNTVFQSYALFPHLTVFENVAFGLRARGVPVAETARKVRGTLEMLAIEPHARRLPGQLSGGERQRVAVARAIVNEPELLLLDEPLSALDARLRRDVQLELRRLQRRLGTTFLLVTHDQAEAVAVSDRIFVLNRGRVEQVGTPQDVYDKPRTRFTAEFLGITNLLTGVCEKSSVHTRLGTMHTHSPVQSGSVLLSIRPERIVLQEAMPTCNAIRVTIREVVYGGDHFQLWVEPGPLRVRLSASTPFPAGSETWAYLPPEHLQPLCDETARGSVP